MWAITTCENPSLDPTQQSLIINKRGVREDSWGNSQIHLPDHPEVTKKQAQDPFFAANFMAKSISEGHIGWWSCARILGYVK